MSIWRWLLVPPKSPQQLADEREARALRAYLTTRDTQRELDRAVEQAARIAETVARLAKDVRYLR